MSGDELHGTELAHVAGPGALLRSAREGARLSAEHVARRLRLGTGIIRALEADDYSGISNPSFARGYLRNYARLVGVSEQRVLDECDRLGLHVAQPDVKPAHRALAQARSSDPQVRWATYLIVSSIIAAMLVWWWQTKPPVETTQESTELQVTEPAPRPENPAGPPEALAPADADPMSDQRAGGDAAWIDNADIGPGGSEATEMAAIAAEPAAAGDGAAQAPPAEATAPASAATAPSAAPAASPVPEAPAAEAVATPHAEPPAETAAAPLGLNRLTLTFTEPCWVEILDGEGKRLLSGTMPAGASHTLQSKVFQLRLGNSRGVQLRYNGERFDQSRFAPRNVARFTLGDS